VSSAYELTGEAAPPMVNGELAFDEPWQGRVFGMARGLAERGVFEWDAFRARLIEQIASFDRMLDRGAGVVGMSTPDFHYYEHFLRALESLLVDRSIIAPGELLARVRAFDERPHGHDHPHDHDHDHDHDHARVG
jgi:nitrile hydratase accessory protein